MRNTIRTLLALATFAVLSPVYAQEHAQEHGHTVQTTRTTTIRTTTTRKAHPSSRAQTRVWNDTNRLASLLHDASRANLNSGAWRITANESSRLADRIYTNASSPRTAHNAARELRLHVRMMRNAALKGDADSAKDHARQALPYAYRLMDWSGGTSR